MEQIFNIYFLIFYPYQKVKSIISSRGFWGLALGEGAKLSHAFPPCSWVSCTATPACPVISWLHPHAPFLACLLVVTDNSATLHWCRNLSPSSDLDYLSVFLVVERKLSFLSFCSATSLCLLLVSETSPQTWNSIWREFHPTIFVFIKFYSMVTLF